MIELLDFTSGLQRTLIGSSLLVTLASLLGACLTALASAFQVVQVNGFNTIEPTVLVIVGRNRYPAVQVEVQLTRLLALGLTLVTLLLIALLLITLGTRPPRRISACSCSAGPIGRPARTRGRPRGS